MSQGLRRVGRGWPPSRSDTGHDRSVRTTAAITSGIMVSPSARCRRVASFNDVIGGRNVVSDITRCRRAPNHPPRAARALVTAVPSSGPRSSRPIARGPGPPPNPDTRRGRCRAARDRPRTPSAPTQISQQLGQRLQLRLVLRAGTAPQERRQFTSAERVVATRIPATRCPTSAWCPTPTARSPTPAAQPSRSIRVVPVGLPAAAGDGSSPTARRAVALRPWARTTHVHGHADHRPRRDLLEPQQPEHERRLRLS